MPPTADHPQGFHGSGAGGDGPLTSGGHSGSHRCEPVGVIHPAGYGVEGQVCDGHGGTRQICSILDSSDRGIEVRIGASAIVKSLKPKSYALKVKVETLNYSL